LPERIVVGFMCSAFCTRARGTELLKRIDALAAIVPDDAYLLLGFVYRYIRWTHRHVILLQHENLSLEEHQPR
jgi:hypothetical protein